MTFGTSLINPGFCDNSLLGTRSRILIPNDVISDIIANRCNTVKLKMSSGVWQKQVFENKSGEKNVGEFIHTQCHIGDTYF